jgi:hypothetical protein
MDLSGLNKFAISISQEILLSNLGRQGIKKQGSDVSDPCNSFQIISNYFNSFQFISIPLIYLNLFQSIFPYFFSEFTPGFNTGFCGSFAFRIAAL